MLRALADLAEQFPCSCPDLMIESTDSVLLFGDTSNQKPTASRISVAFGIGVADFELRMAYGIAYKRHSGEHAPFLLSLERDEVERRVAAATLTAQLVERVASPASIC